MNITILGAVPSKKNSKRIFRPNGGGIVFTPSKNHQDWHESAMWQLAGWRNEQPASVRNNLPRRTASVSIIIFAKTEGKADLTNKAESVMDLLVDARIIEDDNWHVVPNVLLAYGGKDAKNPRAEVIII